MSLTPTVEDTRDVLDVDAVAQLLRCEPETVERQTRARVLPGIKLGRAWVYPRQALLQVLCRMALANVAPADAPVTAPKGRGSRRREPPVLPPFPPTAED